MLLPGCGLRSWHIVQKERCDDSPQTPLSACRGGTPPPPPTSVTGPPVRDGAGGFGVPVTAATIAMRTRTVVPPPRATHVVRRRKRLFFSELNSAPSAGDGRISSSDIEHDSALQVRVTFAHAGPGGEASPRRDRVASSRARTERNRYRGVESQALDAVLPPARPRPPGRSRRGPRRGNHDERHTVDVRHRGDRPYVPA